MRNEPCLSSLAFSLGPYRLACALERGHLSLRVSATETRPHQLALARLANVGSELQLAISSSLSSHQQLQSPVATESEEERLFERVSGLESCVADLQRRLDGQGRPRKGGPSERRASRGNLRERTQAMVLGSLREREDRQISGIIQESVEQNMKMERLNDILQEKLLRREGDLLDLERSILEREDLIRELAEKLITANMEKEDIFCEYEKILQNTVFHQEDRQKQAETPTQPSLASEEAQIEAKNAEEAEAEGEVEVEVQVQVQVQAQAQAGEQVEAVEGQSAAPTQDNEQQLFE